MENWGVIGHHMAISVLQKQLESGRLGHALLLTGPAQIGKSLVAFRLAQAINCLNEGKRPCGVCRSCSRIERGVHPDIIHVERETSSIKIDTIRKMQQGLNVPPLEARDRIVIIHDLQYASGEAMDSLLKTLEEPPSRTRIIITASASEVLLPTIVSRCQIIPLRLVAPKIIADGVLEQAQALSEAAADEISRVSAGRPGWALQAVQDEALLTWRSEAIEALKSLLVNNRSTRFEAAKDMAYADSLTEILEMWQSFWRDALLWSEGLPEQIVNVDQQTAFEQINEQTEQKQIVSAIRAIHNAQAAMERNANKRMVLDVMFLRLPYLKLSI